MTRKNKEITSYPLIKKIFYVIVFILTLPFALIFWTTLFFIFKNSVLPKLDFGSVSDWVSACTSALTLIVAYLAYKAAPNWLTQKSGEQALELAGQLIEIDNEKLITLVDNLYSYGGEFSKAARTCYRENDMLTAHAYREKFRETWDQLISQLKEIEKVSDSLARRGWILKNDYSDTFRKFNEKSISNVDNSFNSLSYFTYLTDKLNIKSWQESSARITNQDETFQSFDDSMINEIQKLKNYTTLIKENKNNMKDFFNITYL